ncbi:exonuclease SbcCD subunit D [bacterium]|nr:exonuclease SbcCD subunit D [bacterium]
MAFTFVHAADLHLDCPFDSLGYVSPELASVLQDATFASLDNIVKLCLVRKVNFVVIAGDVYNSSDKSLRAQLRFRSALETLSEAEISSYIVCGNHDPSNGWSASLNWPEHAHFFSSSEPEVMPVVRNGNLIATVNGISHSKQGITENLALRLSHDKGSPFAIALLHCNCGQAAAYDPYAPCTLADLTRSTFDYWALGHIHKRMILHESAPLVVYPGNSQGLNPKEIGAKGCYVVSVDDSGSASMEFAQTNAVRWHQEEISAAGIASEQELIESLSERVGDIRQSAVCPVLVRFRITGRMPLHRSITRTSILDDITADLRHSASLQGNFVWVESIMDETRPDINIDERRLSEDFVGDFLRLAQEMRQCPDRIADLRSALEPLFEHGRARAYLGQPSDDQLLAWLDAATLYGLDALTEET